jgi:hypothetical protein
MSTRHALCLGAGLRICDGCNRHADNHPKAATRPHQPWVSPTRNDRCAHWLAKPHAITPTDRRN